MKTRILAKRYAEAFLGYVRLTRGMEQAVGEMQRVKEILRLNPELGGFFANRNITCREKCSLVEAVFAGVLLAETRTFFKLLIEKDRIDLIREIAEYVRVTYAHGGKTDAVLKTTFPLDTDLLDAVKHRLEEKLGKRLNLYIDMDSTLLGGMRVEIGTTIIDGSAVRRIDELKQKLAKVQVN